MSKTKLLLELADCLRNVSATLEEITACITGNDPPTVTGPAGVCANSAATQESPRQDAGTQAEATQDAVNHTSGDTPLPPTRVLAPNERVDPVSGEIVRLDLPTLRALAASKAQTAEQKARMRALLNKHGVSRLPDLPLSDYFAFQKEVEELE